MKPLTLFFSIVIFIISISAYSQESFKMYEAEKAKIADGATIKNDSEVKDKKCVEIKKTGSITWTVKVPLKGRYLLLFRIKCIDWDKCQNITINDTKKTQIGFPLRDGNWNNVKWYTELKAGTNTIEISSNWGYMDFDYLKVSDSPIIDNPVITPQRNIFYKEEPRDIHIKISLNGHKLNSILLSNNKKIKYSIEPYKYQEFAERITISKDQLSKLETGNNVLKLVFDDNSFADYNLKVLQKITNHPLNILALDVNHGNSVLILLPDNKTALVDSGKDYYAEKVVMPLLDRLGIKQINYYILTHYHDDHWGKYKQILKKYNVPKDGFIDYNTVKAGDVLNLGGAKIKILNASENGKPDDENSKSISFKLEYKNFIYTHGADIYAENQQRILKEFPNDIEADVYYCNHHLHGLVDIEYMRKTNPYLFITSAQEAVYARGAYAAVFKEDIVDYLHKHKGHLLDDLLTLEAGTVVIRVNSGKDWTYEEYLYPADIPREGLQHKLDKQHTIMKLYFKRNLFIKKKYAKI